MEIIDKKIDGGKAFDWGKLIELIIKLFNISRFQKQQDFAMGCFRK